jgi:hypothetical protein
MVASSDSASRFPTFQFMFAVMFVHEIGGHLLVTFLTNGRRPFTPPSMSAAGFGNEDDGESGRYFEHILWGGTMAFYRDPAQGSSQVKQFSSGFTSKQLTPRNRAACLIWMTILGDVPVEFLPPVSLHLLATVRICPFSKLNCIDKWFKNFRSL